MLAQRLPREAGRQDVADVLPEELIARDQQLAGLSRVAIEVRAGPVDHEHHVRNGPENRANENYRRKLALVVTCRFSIVSVSLSRSP